MKAKIITQILNDAQVLTRMLSNVNAESMK